MNGAIQYAQPIQGADMISQLPSDQSQPSHNEIRIVETLFKENKDTISTIATEGKDAIFIGALFVIFNLPIVTSLVLRFVPSAETSMYVMVGVKAIALMLTYWVVKHFYLSRKA
jgi:hypothetical protein